MEELQRLQEYCEKNGCACAANEPMSNHTSFRIGGPAELFIRPADQEEARGVIREANRLKVPLTLTGRGSDLLVSDEGLKGAVLSLDGERSSPTLRAGDDTLIDCPAGVSVADLCKFALSRSLTGLEFAYGIPGSVGGAIYMNAGAYDGETKDVAESADYLDPDGEPQTLGREALDFAYRHSWFTDHPGFLITSAAFRLKKGDPAAIKAKMEDLMERRVSKQPLEYPSAGSTFKRPAGAYASALIDQCGLKGRRVGGAMVSEKHAGFVINFEGATCCDVKELISQVQKEVFEKTGYSLECEIKLL